MQITVRQFSKLLSRFEPESLVCFSHCPRGLTFYRLKDRGTVLQLEFDQIIHRDENGSLVIYHIGNAPKNPKQYAVSVGYLLDSLKGVKGTNREIQFGGSRDALSFKGLRSMKFGEWVCVEFDQLVTSGKKGELIMEELVDGRSTRKSFPPLPTCDPSEAKGGAFRAIREGGRRRE